MCATSANTPRTLCRCRSISSTCLTAWAGPFWTSSGATIAPTVRVLALDVWGAVGRIDLLFAGELCLRKIISTATDQGRCQEVTGRIETELFVDYGAPRGARRP